ncbi:hypothetical protein J4458_06020 [Candidatus Woesearchaeota archaeon]|nr:hypothetical protein [Candidatus Woesearchaeota archaeon]
MKKEKKKLPNWKNLILVFFAILAIIIIFTFIDFLFHKLSEEYYVPSYYFRNKVIFGTVIGFAAFIIARKQKLWIKSLAFSATVSILLQARYYLEGYPKDFVLLFLVIHFLILLPLSAVAFWLMKKYKG